MGIENSFISPKPTFEKRRRYQYRYWSTYSHHLFLKLDNQKTPLVAIQQNINKEINQSIAAKDIKVNINFVEPNANNNDDIIEAEIKEWF